MSTQRTAVAHRLTPPMAKFKGTNVNLKKVPNATSRSSDRWYHDPEKRKVLYVLGGSFGCVMIIGALFAVPIVLVIELNKTTTTTATTSTHSTAAPSAATSNTTISSAINTTVSSTVNTTASTSAGVNANVSYAPNTAAVAMTTDAATMNTCLNMTCAFSSVSSISPYYGYERLYINCTESLASMVVEIVVQRTVNASNALQYQTFWNLTTNQTYIQTNTQIIYTWTLLNGQIISDTAFPYYVEGQFNLIGVNQTTNLDTYYATLTSICGYTITQNGTF